uniref:Membrane-associated protein n=1 Tax=Spumella elongata TaxID=89044 RepID=A0A7S3GVN0_9STRA|mmetsp:Transcript_21573/g.37272  ORF Transcript_21573/g.37272 Transcript_21573/m.37272 type:complete len:294 (+) Transcript_21573:13-894(+)
MVHSLLLVVLSALVCASLVSSQEYYYCADVSVAAGGGVSTTSQGYFSMKIGEGYSKYAFSVDLSAVDNCDFSVYPTVAYHIHTNTFVNSCTDTNGHYDPSLACSEKSQAHATSCTQLSRTSASGYVYTCSATAGTVTYSTPTGGCEVGDLSGKLGKITLPASKVAASSQVYTDYVPPYNYNYGQATTGVTSGWASIVFHCGDAAGTRIACGNFALTTQSGTASCGNFDADAWVQNESCDNNDDNADLSEAGFDALVAVVVLGWVLVAVLFVYACFCRGPLSGDAKPMMNSNSA